MGIGEDKKSEIMDRLAVEMSKVNLTKEEWDEVADLALSIRAKKRDAAIREKQRLREEEERRKIEEDEKRREALVGELTSMDLPLSYENAFIGSETAAGITVDSPEDGLVMSIQNLGRVDIEYISAISGVSLKDVINALKGSIFQNPDTWDECFYKGWEVADGYLSGSLLRKYRTAETANIRYNGYFEDNLVALKAAMPKSTTYEDIYVTLGSPWVPPDVIDEFIEYLLGDDGGMRGDDGYGYRPDMQVRYEEVAGAWHVPAKHRYRFSVRSVETYGTKEINALQILEKTLNMQNIKIFDEVRCNENKSGKKKVVNHIKTLIATEKQQKIVETFHDWVWKDDDRKKRLEDIYNDTYGNSVRRNFDGSFLTFPGISDKVDMRSYQKDAVAKILFSPNVLLAHEVGAGKTYVMIAAGMELRRLGISKKNMYVVPNGIIGQWHSMFLELYPQAKLLVVSPKNFTPEKRIETLNKMWFGDYDAIIIAYSSFDMIPLSKDYRRKTLEDQLKRIAASIKKTKGDVTGRLTKKKEKIESELRELKKHVQVDVEICFDDLKINTLFVDEAHNFKNISISSKISDMQGLSKTGSAKCNDMLEKVRLVQRNNGGRGIVFATGTPVTNSITDIFVMQTYLQYGELKLLKIDSFDNWAGMFAEKVSDFEIDPTSAGYRMSTRFSKFHNLSELTSTLAQVADFLHAPYTDGMPEFEGYTDKLVTRSKDLEKFVEKLSTRADNIRHGRVKREKDNMLKITTDGRKAALDMRLVDESKAFYASGKAAICAETAAGIYFRTANSRSTQLIFCDTSVPNGGFNVYGEIKRLLVLNGVPSGDIAFIHDHESDKKKNELFEMMKSGEIRILLGSTFKLGIGVNVQKRLVAIHHLDIPWRPSDMVQREGRILRQGNENKKVNIFRYITEGSFDAYSWQLLETKQRFIVDLLSGFSLERTSSDIDDTVLSYAEVKALATGNPLVKMRIETINELMRTNALNKSQIESKIKLEQEKKSLPARISRKREILEKALIDAQYYLDNMRSIKEIENRSYLRELLHTELQANVLRREEKMLFEYQGFKVILPPNMVESKPFVWLEAEGRYKVELGDTEMGNFVRIDNCLNTFSQYIEEKRREIAVLERRQSEIDAELSKETAYTEKISELKLKLAELDDKLGVKKK